MTHSLKDKVEYCLKMITETRNSDITLTVEVWKKYYSKYLKEGKDGNIGIYLKDLYSIPREDAVKRMRAHFQNDLDKYLPTKWEVAKKRKIKRELWANYMATVKEFS